MSHRLTALISAVVVFTWTPVAFAQIWSAAGATGIVDEADQKIVQFNSAGSASVRRSARGTLDVRFPVQTVPDLLVPQEGDCPEINAVLRDTGPGARVIVRLMQLGVRSGFEGQLTPLGEIDTDTYPPLGDPNQYRSYRACLNAPSGSEFLFDFSFYTYYVEVQLIKTSATANPGVMALQICPSQDRCEP